MHTAWYDLSANAICTHVTSLQHAGKTTAKQLGSEDKLAGSQVASPKPRAVQPSPRASKASPRASGGTGKWALGSIQKYWGLICHIVVTYDVELQKANPMAHEIADTRATPLQEYLVFNEMSTEMLQALARFYHGDRHVFTRIKDGKLPFTSLYPGLFGLTTATTTKATRKARAEETDPKTLMDALFKLRTLICLWLQDATRSAESLRRCLLRRPRTPGALLGSPRSRRANGHVEGVANMVYVPAPEAGLRELRGPRKGNN